MLSVKQVTNKSKNCSKIKALYQTAFPKEERMPFWLLMARSGNKNVEFLTYYDGTQFCGFTYLVTLEQTTFVLYLAVDGQIRSKGYGSQILRDISERHPNNTIILEIEPVEAAAENFEQRKKRKEFYLRNGFESSGYMIHLFGTPYELLTKGPHFDTEQLLTLLKRFTFGLIRFQLRAIS